MTSNCNARKRAFTVPLLLAIALLRPALHAQAPGGEPPAGASASVAAPVPGPASAGAPAQAPAAPDAAKAKKTDLQVAEGLENWKAGIDLSPYAPGKYNLVVQGRDAAGNLTEYPPMNVYIDPASDLPVVAIVNPTPSMRVGGDLNVVGTCVDDDGIERVEMSLDGGTFLPVEGTEFWSHYIETAELLDGRRTIEVRGVDVNGLAGKPVRVAFDLDRAKPKAEVASPPAGSLVSGQVRLEGSVFDLNGIRSLEISQDGGATFRKVDLAKGKDPTRLSFAYPVDTRKLRDGPNVFWLRSVDGVGSQDKAAYLVFVDNTKPVIEIARPEAGRAVNGRFSVAGAVRDVVGVKSLSYVFDGTQKGEIPLTKGDPYFVAEFDAGAVKGDKAEVVLVAEDTIGNVTRLAISPKIDRRADMPVLTVASPAPGGVLRAGDSVWGSIRDDDGVKALRWSMDGGPASELGCSETFSLTLPADLAWGKHLLSLTPVDSNGTAGDKVALAFSYDRGAAAVRFERLVGPKGERPFTPGIEARVDGGEALEGIVMSPNALGALVCAVGSSAPRPLPFKAEGGSYRFRLPIDRSLPYGFVALTVTATDSFGASSSGKTLLYLVNYGAVREDTGFRFVDPRVPEAAAGAEAPRVAFGPPAASGGPGDILGAFHREELESIRLEPPTALVKASFEGPVVRLSAASEGSSAPTRIVGRTRRGHEFSAGPYVFVTDSAGPLLELGGVAEGAWFRSAAAVEGKASDSGGLASIAYRVIPAGGWPGDPVEVSPAADGSFSIKLDAASLQAGPLVLEVEAKDRSGNASKALRCLGADAEPPTLRFVGPEPGAETWGPEDVVALLSDASGIASVEYAEDGSSFAPVTAAKGFFIHRADLAAHPDAKYRVVDLAGNATLARPEVRIVAPPSRLPRAENLSVEPAPAAEGKPAEARVELAGTSGARKVSLVLPALGDADFAALGLAAGDQPPARLATRLLVSGPLALKGQVIAAAPADGSAAPPLKAVSASLDGGATYLPLASYKDEKSAKPALPFSLAVPAASLKPGEARWILKVEDFSGAALFCPIYALVDTAPPAAALLYPEAGAAALPGPFPLLVKVEDEGPLASVEFAIGAAKESVDYAAGGGRYFARSVDPAALKGAPVAVSVQARDAAGNTASLAAKYAYDAARDAPVIALAEPPAILRAGDLLSGSAGDDDGAPAMEVSIDGAPPLSFTAGSFALALPALTGGLHQLLVAATDSGGKRTELKKPLKVVGDPPLLGPVELGDAKSRTPWSPGMTFAQGPGSLLAGSATAPNGLASVELSANGGPAIKASLGKAAAPGEPVPFTVALPALPFDRITLTLKAVDAAGLATEARCELHGVLPSALEADDAEALRFSDERIEASGEGSTFLLAPGDTLQGRFNGRPVEDVSIRPATDRLEASFEGPIVRLKALAEGVPAQASLVVRTVDGDEFAWGPFAARVDAAPPAIEIAAPSDHEWARAEARVAGKASDPAGILLLEVSVNGGEPRSLLPAPAAAGAAPAAESSFNAAVPLAAAADGSVRLEFRARDAAGRESRVARYINKDTLAPAPVQVIPAPGESVNGTTTLVVEASDSGRLLHASFLPEPGAAAEEVKGLGTASRTLDFARLALPLPEGGGFVFEDAAGNKAVLAPALVVDMEKDKPVAEIHAPLDMEVLRGDFAISGVAYDDDGLAAAHYRVDGGEWTRLAMEGTSFNVPVALKDTTDNEHLVEVRTEDIYGVQGDVVSRSYRVSKAEPVARMTDPPIAKPSRGVVELAGNSSDANGIEEIAVSVDNRVSYNRPSGTEAWRYVLDTKALADGLHPVAVRPVDRYGTEGFYASLVYVDNTPPVAAIDLPADGAACRREILVSGRVSDNIALASSRIEIAPVGRASPPSMTIELGVGGIVRRTVDASGLAPGAYTVRIVARDRADNEALASRDIVVEGGGPANFVELLYPLEGSSVAGKLIAYGRAVVAGGASKVLLRSGETALGEAAPDENGYFAVEASTKTIEDGVLSLVAVAVPADPGLAAVSEVASRPSRVEWKRLGPWISIGNFPLGRYLPYRPYLEGTAGWAMDFPDPEDKVAVEAYRKAQKERIPVAVEVSLDNGRSFLPASGTEKWRFRLETQVYPEGGQYFITRARFKDGSSASAKTLLFLDKTRPEVEVDRPVEDGRYNGVLAVSGTAFDANGLAEVTVAIRKGDKKSYAVPAFIQGLYLDGHVLGATTWEAGLGLTFFDDNVKLQASYGQAPGADELGNPQRFYGDVLAAKLIANIGLLPFNALFGPDWDWLSASLGVGANFSYFTKSQGGDGLIVSAVFGQLEFPKLTMKDLKFFKTFSVYTEMQVWVVSSDVEGGFIPRMSFGTRVGLF